MGVACLSVTVTETLPTYPSLAPSLSVCVCAACQGNAFKQFFIFIYIFIKTNHTENVICKKGKRTKRSPQACALSLPLAASPLPAFPPLQLYQSPVTAHNSRLLLLFFFFCSFSLQQKCKNARKEASANAARLQPTG